MAIALVASLCLAASTAGAATRVVLLPIAVHATSAEVDYLQNGLMEMLASRLDQYDGLVVVRPGGDAVPASDGDSARERGRDQEGDYVVFGSFTRFGDGASLDLRCASVVPADDDDARDTTRRVFVQSGNLAEIIPQLDTLAQKVARYTVTGGGQPRRIGEAGVAPVAVAPDYADLLRRVEALERAAQAPSPVAGAAPPDAPTETDSDS
jgi:outer membrane protein insertion porin family